MEELIKKLNDLKITQVSSDWEEDIPEDIYSEYFEDKFEVLGYDLYIDTHRWYETSITVLDFGGGVLIGIRYITNMFSEAQDYEDCYHTLEFFKMEEIQITSYKIIK